MIRDWGGNRDRGQRALKYAATLVELSGLHFEAGDGESAVAVLGQAVTALDSLMLDHPRAARDDVRLRLAAAQLLQGSSQPLDLPELGPEPTPEVLRLHAALTDYMRSRLSRRRMRPELQALIGAAPSWGRDENEFWLYDHVPMEPAPLAALQEPGSA